MKINLIKKAAKLITIITAIVSVFTIYSPVYAASASLYLSPSSGSVAQGNYITISVRENSGSESVNAAQVNLSYPSNLLSFVSITSSSAFSIVAQNSGGGGSVSIGRGALPAVSGIQTIASVRFKALTNSGKATVSINGSSSVVSANSNTNIATSLVGGSYSLTNPPPAPVAPPKDITPPKITSLAVSSTTVATTVISWTTSEPASSEVDYGINKSYGLAATDGNLVTEHKITLNSPIITPATTYHYIVKSVDAAGNAASSEDNSFITKGASLRITVLDQAKKAVKAADVSIDDKQGSTDSKGQVVLSNVSLGKKTIVVTYKDQKFVKGIEISKADPQAPQDITVYIKRSSNGFWIPILLISLGAVVAYLLMAGLKSGNFKLPPFLTRLRGRLSKDNSASAKSTQDEPKIIKPSN